MKSLKKVTIISAIISVLVLIFIIAKNNEEIKKIPIGNNIACINNDHLKKLSFENYRENKFEEITDQEKYYNNKLKNTIQAELSKIFIEISDKVKRKSDKNNLNTIITSFVSINLIFMISNSGKIIDKKVVCSDLNKSLENEILSNFTTLTFDKFPKNLNKEQLIYQIDIYPSHYGLRFYSY